VGIKDSHTFHTAARGIFLQDIAAQVFLGQLGNAADRIGAHRLSVVNPGLGHAKSNIIANADQPKRFAGRAQAQLHFRTDRDPFHITAEYFNQVGVPLVAAVVSNLFTQQAR
jgi:hypothetical protein